MSPLIFWLTAIFLPLPLFMLWAMRGAGAPLNLGAPIFIGALWIFIWLWFRPTRFELSESGLRLVWPIRSDDVPISHIEYAEIVSRATFKSRYGKGMRIGAGGLWGGFGLCWTPKQMFRLYISRVDELVVVHTRKGRPLLITPARPRIFVEELNGFAQRT